jgi:hypothetical protein
MNENPGRRRNVPADPTSAPAADPVPTGDDVLTPRERPPVRTPRRYDEPADDGVMPADAKKDTRSRRLR